MDESLADEAVELPTEEDGSLLLSVLVSQFETATGREVEIMYKFVQLRHI